MEIKTGEEVRTEILLGKYSSKEKKWVALNGMNNALDELSTHPVFRKYNVQEVVRHLKAMFEEALKGEK